jgi:Uma2 family endonuclease
MNAAQNVTRLTVEEYLEGEKQSEVRHEYIGGEVYAMAGASQKHNTICGNIFAALHSHLRGKPCQAFVADLKVRLSLGHNDIFYYPDVMVACDPRDKNPYFRQFPQVIFEVVSESTERTDKREKFISYTQIETLQEYVLVEQDRSQVTIFRRENHWQPELLQLPTDEMRIPSLDFSQPLASIYERATN